VKVKDGTGWLKTSEGNPPFVDEGRYVSAI
jgi:hypothetical protein